MISSKELQDAKAQLIWAASSGNVTEIHKATFLWLTIKRAIAEDALTEANESYKRFQSAAIFKES